ncbi:MAG: flagellar basal body-associated FliL family protein [Pseudomonadota bacterium]
MADDTEGTQEEVKRGLGPKAWIGVAVMALALGGGGFYATYAGLIAGHDTANHDNQAAHETDPMEHVDFVELDPLRVSVGGEGSIRQLQFRAYLQLGSAGARPVEAAKPRIMDIFSTYLRALPVATLEDPTALLRIRSQLLRRVQLLAGPNAVEDLLIIDFVIV